MEWISIVIAVLAAISGILLGWLARAKERQKEDKQAGYEDGALKTDVEYIKCGVDEIKKDMRMQVQRMDTLSERLVRVEESTKRAHERLDRIDKLEE